VQADDADIDYIATMHPGVGLAQADLLEHEAEQFDLIADDDWDHRHRWADPIVAVARLINGGVS